jgi:hypothetical protein
VDKTVNVEVFIPNSEAILDLIDVMGLEVHEESILDGAVSTVQLNDKANPEQVFTGSTAQEAILSYMKHYGFTVKVS